MRKNFTILWSIAQGIELEEFSYTQAYQDKFGNSAVVIESESNQQFNFINEGMLAH